MQVPEHVRIAVETSCNERQKIRARQQERAQRRALMDEQDRHDDEALKAIDGNLTYYEREYGIRPDSSGAVSREVPEANGELPLDQDEAEVEDGAQQQRKRLPRGFAAQVIMDFAMALRRFIHINEYIDAVNIAIAERYPDSGLSANRNSINHNLIELWREGRLVRSVYDGHTHYYFHGLPELVKLTAFGPVYTDPSVAPIDEYLEGVTNPTPEFPDPPL